MNKEFYVHLIQVVYLRKTEEDHHCRENPGLEVNKLVHSGKC